MVNDNKNIEVIDGCYDKFTLEKKNLIDEILFKDPTIANPLIPERT